MGFSSSRHTYANGHCNCDSDGYFYCHSYGNCGANRFFATEQSDRNSDRDGYSDSYGNGDFHSNCYGHSDSNQHGFAYGYSLRYAAMRTWVVGGTSFSQRPGSLGGCLL